MKRVLLDKIASVTRRLELSRHTVLGDDIPAREGTVIAARVLTAKTTYNTLEDVHGRMTPLFPGDVIAGALGHRDALYGFCGQVPESVTTGDRLQILNLGGVIGSGAKAAPGIGEPFQVEVLGSVQSFPHLGSRVGQPSSIVDGALPAMPLPASMPPIVALVGTCMDAGKTTAAAVIIGEMTRRGLRVAAGKLTGVSLRKDVLLMQDSGAEPALLFTDFGVVTTTDATAVRAAHSLVAHLADTEPDVIVLEMGDGILGTYGVQALLADAPFRAALHSIVLCAQDPVGAWGAVELLDQRYGLAPAVVSGRVTDTAVGTRFCSERLGLPAWNALANGKELAEVLLKRLEKAEAR